MNPLALRHDFAVSLIEKRIKISANKWPGRCYEIANKIIKAGIIDDKFNSKSRYGNWIGPISKESSLFKNRLFTHHGWIECETNGWAKLIVDPTRWVFENVKPYIYAGEDEEGYYDVGGNVIRQMMHLNPPEADNEKEFKISFSKVTKDFLLDLLGSSHTHFTTTNLMWIANQSPSLLGPHVIEIYRSLKKAKLGAFIPIDNLDMV